MNEVFEKLLERCEENAFEVHTREFGNVEVVGIDAINDVIEQVKEEYQVSGKERLKKLKDIFIKANGKFSKHRVNSGRYVFLSSDDLKNIFKMFAEIVCYEDIKDNSLPALRKEDADQ